MNVSEIVTENGTEFRAVLSDGKEYGWLVTEPVTERVRERVTFSFEKTEAALSQAS
jgi:hypothetical protein